MSDSIIVNVNPASTDLVVINSNEQTTNQVINVDDGSSSTNISINTQPDQNVVISTDDVNINENVNINQGGFVFSVNGKIGHIILTKEDFGLENVDNTSDLWKPVSYPTLSALALKADLSYVSEITAVQDAFYRKVADQVRNSAPVNSLVVQNSSFWNESYDNLNSLSAFYLGLSGESKIIWDSVYTTTFINSSFWTQAYSNLSANSAFYVEGGKADSKFLALSGGTLKGKLTISNDLSSYYDDLSLLKVDGSVSLGRSTSAFGVNSFVAGSSAVVNGNNSWFIKLSQNNNILNSSIPNYFHLIADNGIFLDGKVGIGIENFIDNKLLVDGSIRTTDIYYDKNGNSDLWNSVYSHVNQTSANEEDQNEVVSFIISNSANLVEVNTKVNNSSAIWDSVYSSWNNTSAFELDLRNFVYSNSAVIRNVNLQVTSTSANWNSVYSSWNQNSALDLESRTFINSNSSNVLEVNTEVNTTSSNWNSVYSSWNQNSSFDLEARNFVNSNSANTLEVNTEVNTTSSNWNSVYSSWNQNSALDLESRTFINSNSANIINVNTEVNTTSSNWNSVYSSWNSASALELQVRNFTNSNSANIRNVNTVVNTTSASWNSVFSSWNQNSALDLESRTFINSNSANIINVNTKVNTTSANWDSVYAFINQTSAFEEDQNEVVSFIISNSSNIINVNTKVNDTSGNWDSVYSIVQNFSTSWEESADIIPTVQNYLSTNLIKISSLSVFENISANKQLYSPYVSTSNINLGTNGKITVMQQNSSFILFERDSSGIKFGAQASYPTFPRIDFSHWNLSNINTISISDPGPSEGITWGGTNAGWSIDVSPLTRTNSDGNLNLYGTSQNIAIWRPTLFVSNSQNYAILQQTIGGGLHFTTFGDSSANITFSPSGNFGIGTLSPNEKLTVVGTISTDLHYSSKEWISSYLTLNSLSAGLFDSQSFINSNSSTLIQTRTEVLSQSSNNRSVYSIVNTTSANWNSVYSTWNENSANLLEVESFVRESSANNSVFNTVCALSTNWDSVYSNVNLLSSSWNSVYSSWNQNSALDLESRTFINNNSANIVNVNTKVNTTSANWDSVYSIFNLNSGEYESVYSNVNTNSSSWSSIYSLATGLSSDWSNLGKLTSTVVSDLSVGAITAAQVFQTGTTFQQFVEALLTKIYYPTFTNRTLTVTSNLGGNNTNVEIGTTSVTLTLTYTRGQIRGKTVNGIWDPNLLQGYRTGSADNYIIFGNTTTSNQSTSSTAIIAEGSNIYNVTCNYAAGDQPYDSRNNPYLTAEIANSVSTSMTLNGRRRAFFGADAQNFVPTNSPEVRALSQNLLNPQNGSQFTINVPSGAARVIIAYPASLRDVTTIYYPPLQSNVKTTFTQTTVSVSAANNLFPTNYRVYYYIPEIPFGGATSYIITI